MRNEELVIIDGPDGQTIEVPRKEYKSTIDERGYASGRQHLLKKYTTPGLTTGSSK